MMGVTYKNKRKSRLEMKWEKVEYIFMKNSKLIFASRESCVSHRVGSTGAQLTMKQQWVRLVLIIASTFGSVLAQLSNDNGNKN